MSLSDSFFFLRLDLFQLLYRNTLLSTFSILLFYHCTKLLTMFQIDFLGYNLVEKDFGLRLRTGNKLKGFSKSAVKIQRTRTKVCPCAMLC